jgi:hypothetical protein
MTTTGLSIHDLEGIYDELALHVDHAGDRSELFLAKLCLLLANQLGDKALVTSLIASASQDL